VKQEHQIERYLRDSCDVRDDEKFRRLGIFLLAHTVVDTHLISVLVADQIKDGVGLVSLEEIQHISDRETSHSTFKMHLERARALIPSRAGEIAEKVNQGRDAFVHFKRGRFELPRYDGQDITTAEGFRVCMDAVNEFLLLVPFQAIAWQANP